MLPDTLDRLSSQRASCKQWSTALAVVILLVGALGKLEPAKLLWAAAPIVLLGLAEAGYAAQERRVAEHLKGRKANDQTFLLSREPAGAGIGRIAVAVTALSVWPFYAGLCAIVAVGGGVMDGPGKRAPIAAAAPTAMHAKASAGGCGSGGCGAGGGCGTSGCGASSGKACGCSGGGAASKTAASAKAAVPPQPYLQTATGPRPLATVSPGVVAGRAVPGRPPMYAVPEQARAAAGTQMPSGPVAPAAAPRAPQPVIVAPVEAPQAPSAPAPTGAPAAAAVPAEAPNPVNPAQ